MRNRNAYGQQMLHPAMAYSVETVDGPGLGTQFQRTCCYLATPAVLHQRTGDRIAFEIAVRNEPLCGDGVGGNREGGARQKGAVQGSQVWSARAAVLWRSPGERRSETVSHAGRGLKVVRPARAGITIDQVCQLHAHVDAGRWGVLHAWTDLTYKMGSLPVGEH